jgi:hypothetical protein
MKQVDMSEAAILRRLKKVDQLRELCLSLMKAKKVSPERLKELQQAKAQNRLRPPQKNKLLNDTHAAHLN